VGNREDAERLELIERCVQGFRKLKEIIPCLREARERFAKPGRRVPVPGNPTWTEWVEKNLGVTVRRVQQLLREAIEPGEIISPGAKSRELAAGDWNGLLKATDARLAQVFGPLEDRKQFTDAVCKYAQGDRRPFRGTPRQAHRDSFGQKPQIAHSRRFGPDRVVWHAGTVAWSRPPAQYCCHPLVRPLPNGLAGKEAAIAMPDRITPEQRSAIMSRIRSKDTQPEVRVRRALHAMGYRFRLHVRSLPGCPDIVFPKHLVALQVRGCFWHLHRCVKHKLPRSNTTYWLPKLKGNRQRDLMNDRRLRRLGWRVRTIWQCQLDRMAAPELRAWLRALFA
jgi:DNA mismatch endonuclease (patch repair protein)